MNNNDLLPGLFKHWIHSREEDTESVKVYRPSNYDFPPSRGREGFDLKENGEFVQYGIAPTDRPQTVKGQWKAEGAKIEAHFEDQKSKPQTLSILSCDEDILRIQSD